MSLKKKIFLFTVIAGILTGSLYLLGGAILTHSLEKWANKLIALDEKGQLSRSFGAAWQEIIYGDAMQRETERLLKGRQKEQLPEFTKGIPLSNYPSLSVIKKLNDISHYSNKIQINDRNGDTIAVITTDHNRVPYDSLPNNLITATLAAEDKTFFTNQQGFEYNSFVRAALRSLQSSLMELRFVPPRGTSTITQQVAKMLVSQLDTKGQRYVSRSIDRKIRELRISVALRKLYTPEEILEVYFNHCLTSSYGLIGAEDISQRLWKKPVSQLNDAEALYLARMVKWGMNFPEKIKRQCHIDMPRIRKQFNWTPAYSDTVLQQIDALTFHKPQQITTNYGHLIDLANVYWFKFLESRGYNKDTLSQFDLLDPSSLIRQKGNVLITMTIDLPLQNFLDSLVENRGFGADTTIITDVRIGSDVAILPQNKKRAMRDTLRQITIIQDTTIFTEAGKPFETTLYPNDTLITNIRYREEDKKHMRRSSFYYTRRPVKVDGQYYAYSIMDAHTGKLLAYTSRDKIGSRAASLLSRPIPNGSSTAKPIFNALMFDLGIFSPDERWSDKTPVEDTTLAWYRELQTNHRGGDAYFWNTGVQNRPYRVRNSGGKLAGDQFVFDLLTSSNNILAVETMYRLNGIIFDEEGNPTENGFALAQLFYRLGIFDQMQKQFRGEPITGVRAYREIARIVGAEVDSLKQYNQTYPFSDLLYSVALGTLELTLFQQMHLFNMFAQNTLIDNPAQHPSLFIDTIKIQNEVFAIANTDTVLKIHPFMDPSHIAPTILGMHNRLAGPYDGLSTYDIATSPFVSNGDTLWETDNGYSNFAKSGTSDDILRPYDKDATNKSRTNYCLWNATLRLNLDKFTPESPKSNSIHDITIACIGEGNRKNTGATDGKSMHKYLTRSLLRHAGIPRGKNGFYHQYETQLRDTTKDEKVTISEEIITE